MSQQINLFNPALLKRKAVFTAVTMVQSLTLLAIGVAALVLYGQHSVAMLEGEAGAGAAMLAQRQVRLAGVRTDFAPRAARPALALEVNEAERQLRALRSVAEVIQRSEFGNTDGYAEYFRALARQSAGDLWLTGVSISGPGRQIGLRGRAMDPTLVPAYIGRLTREPVMQGKSFGSLHISRAALANDKGDKADSPDNSGNSGKEAAALAPYVDFSLQAEAAEPPSGAPVASAGGAEAALLRSAGGLR